MSNNYYTHGSFPSTGAQATSASMRSELDLITAGFDKLPTLTSNANKFVVVNSTGTALIVTSTLPTATVTDNAFTVQDNVDTTKTFQFQASGITTGTLRTFTMPDADTTLVGTGVTQTLTNKTLTSPAINGGTINSATIGATTASTGAFTTLSASSTVSGTGFSTYLASPPAIGGTAAAAGAFTTLSASSTVSGTGFSTYLASPPAIGGTAAAAGTFTTLVASGAITHNTTTNAQSYTTTGAGTITISSGTTGTINNMSIGATTASTGAFTTLSASSTVSGTGFSTYLASPPAIGGTAAAAGSFTALSYSTTLTGGTGVITIGTNQFYKDANGNIGLGNTSVTGFSLRVSKSITGATTATAIRSDGAVQSDVTSAAYPFQSTTALAASVTTSSLYHYYAIPAAGGATSTVTNQAGFFAESTLGTQGAATVTNAYGFYGNLASGTNRWNLYMAGTADNYIAGSVGIGTTPISTSKLTANGSISVNGSDTNFGAGGKRGFIDYTTNVVRVGAVSGGVASGTALAFNVGDVGGSGFEAARIDAGGTVNIGATTTNNVFDQISGARPLLVQKADTSTTLNGSLASITIANSDTTTSNTAQLNFAAITGASTNQYSSAVISAIFGARTNTAYPAGQLVFSTSAAAAAPTERMRIDSSGNVGIGATSPGGKFEVNGGRSVFAPNSEQYAIYLRYNGSTSGFYIGSPSADAMSFSASSGSERMRIDSAGSLNLFGSYTEGVVAIGNSGTAQTLSLASGTVQTVTMTGNCTFTMPTATAGKSFILIVNSGAGSFTGTFTSVKWPNNAAPTLTTTASRWDVLTFVSNGSAWYGNFAQAYA